MFLITNVAMLYMNGEHQVIGYNPNGSQVLFRGEHLDAIRFFDKAKDMIAHADSVGGMAVA